MKMNKWKSVVIKDTSLRKLRKFSRTIIRLAVHDEFENLLKREYLYLNKQTEKSLTPSQQKRSNTIAKLKSDLLQTHYRSILNCSMGSVCISLKSGERADIKSLDLDMVWNPIDENWICINCYNHYFGTDILKNEYWISLEKEKIIDKFLSKKYEVGQSLSEEEEKKLDKCLNKLGIIK